MSNLFKLSWRTWFQKPLRRRSAPIRSVMMEESDLDHLATLHRIQTKNTKR